METRPLHPLPYQHMIPGAEQWCFAGGERAVPSSPHARSQGPETVHVYVYTCIFLCVHTCGCMCVSTCVCTCGCMCTCVRVFGVDINCEHRCKRCLFDRVVQFRVWSKVWVRELSRILTNPINAVRKQLKVRRTLCPFFEILGPKIVDKNAGKSLGWPSNALFCVYW